MIRERALKVALVLVGLFFTAGIYPMVMILYHRDSADGGDAMMLSLYFTLGILLLIASLHPSAHRSLIAFAAWSSFAHAAVMAIMAFQGVGDRGALWASAVLVVIGSALIMLRPPKLSVTGS